MTGQIRYCTTEDGVRIAYRVDGEGPPVIFCHFVYALAHTHMVPVYHEAIERIGRGRRLVRYDVRGSGLSQRDVDDLSPAAVLRDLDAVVKALSLDRVSILGAAMGGLRAIEYAALGPDRVASLVLYEAFPRLSAGIQPDVLRAFAQLARANWPLATQTFTDAGVRREDGQTGLRWAEMLQASTTGETVAQLIETHAEYDVTALLSRVECPTIICHSRNDRLYPFALGQQLAEGIPNARLIPLEEEASGPFTNPGAAIEAIDAFLSEPSSARIAHSAPAPPAVHLTPRELEVLRLIAAGKTTSEISAALSMRPRTVGRHITHIYAKVGARGRADATSYALRHGIVGE